jgi:hypothetical protein
MAAPILIRRELTNVRLYFIPAGEVVDTVPVSISTWPDNAPTSNYTAYAFIDIETMKEAKEVNSETFSIPKDAGGYFDDIEETVKSRKWTASTAKTNNYLKKLEHGLAAVPVVGTAQAPNVNNSNFIDGVLLMEIQDKTGPIIERTQVWARLRLASTPDVGPTTRKFDLVFEQRDSGNNTFVIAG